MAEAILPASVQSNETIGHLLTLPGSCDSLHSLTRVTVSLSYCQQYNSVSQSRVLVTILCHSKVYWPFCFFMQADALYSTVAGER